MKPTRTERLILANQYRILAKLHPEAARECAFARTVLEHGYEVSPRASGTTRSRRSRVARSSTSCRCTSSCSASSPTATSSLDSTGTTRPRPHRGEAFKLLRAWGDKLLIKCRRMLPVFRVTSTARGGQLLSRDEIDAIVAAGRPPSE